MVSRAGASLDDPLAAMLASTLSSVSRTKCMSLVRGPLECRHQLLRVRQETYAFAVLRSDSTSSTTPDTMALCASNDTSSTYIQLERLCPTSPGSTAVAITTGLRPYGATPSRKVADRVAIR